MPKRNAEQKAARELQLAEGLGYQDALKRVRAETVAGPAATEPPAPQPPAVAYVLQPTPAELKAAPGITAEELGVRALPADATPGRRAHAEAVWRPEADPARPCRCSGTGCHHGERCTVGEDEGAADGADQRCTGRLVHADRHPGSLWGLTEWWDTYECAECGEQAGAGVELPAIPWGEQRPRDAGGITTVVYDGVRHPNFPGFDEDQDEGELDPDEYPTPEDDLYGDEDQDDEGPLAEEDQEEELDHLDDVPEGDVDPAEDYDGPAEEEPSTPPGIPVTDLDGQPTAADWSPAFDLDNAPPSAW
ncbi:hypothetical protein ACFTZG_12255 [Streptomyces albidoflavus]|uniref:hypothetical protein n=1 Tax=Streptomyces albidoflavus TaxID=1886 RepID=UPI0004CC34F3|nr:hypothetical protein [Streptomyces albidoflavus]